MIKRDKNVGDFLQCLFMMMMMTVMKDYGIEKFRFMFKRFKLKTAEKYI